MNAGRFLVVAGVMTVLLASGVLTSVAWSRFQKDCRIDVDLQLGRDSDWGLRRLSVRFLLFPESEEPGADFARISGAGTRVLVEVDLSGSKAIQGSGSGPDLPQGGDLVSGPWREIGRRVRTQ